jgi:HEAT repeat protein
MHQIRNLTLIAVVCGLFLSTFVGSVSVGAAVQDAAVQDVGRRSAWLNNAAVVGQPVPAPSGERSLAAGNTMSFPGFGLDVPTWVLWPLGLIELWLVGWIGVWTVALCGSRRFLFDVDCSLRNFTFWRVPFSNGAPLTLAHLTLVRAFAQHPWVTDEWLNQHSQAITDWLAIDSRGAEPGDRDILVRIEGQAIAIADAPTVRAILPETPFVLAIHGEGRKWNDRVLNIVLGQSMHAERAGRLMAHRTIPVVLDRNCVERFQAKGKAAGDLPHWLQVVRNELCRIPGLAVSLDDDLLKCLVKSKRIMPLVDQWSRTPVGLRTALQAAVSAGELPCLVVFDDDDSVAEMKSVIRARSLNSHEFATRSTAVTLKTEARTKTAASEASTVSSSVKPRLFDRTAVPFLIQSLDDSVADVRLAAAQTLGGLGTAARESVNDLTALLNDPVSACRLAAINALGAIGSEAASATDSLTKAAVNDHRKVRAAACRALGAIGSADGSVLKTLVDALGDKDAAVRSQAARSLGGFGPGQPEVLSALTAALSDDSPEVRGRVVSAISAIPRAVDQSIASLVAAVADPAAEVRREVVSALGKASQSRHAIVQTLAHSLTDPDSLTRSRAAASLSRFGLESRPAIPRLARLVSDSEAEVRRSAVEALGSIGVPSLESVSALEEATRDIDESVRTAATNALERTLPAAAVA